MFRKLSIYWNKLSVNGIREHHTYDEIKRIKLLNQSALIGVIISILYFMILIALTIRNFHHSSFDKVFFFDVLFLIVIFSMSIINFRLTKKVRYKTSSIFMLIAFPTALLILNYFLGDVGSKFYSFSFLILGFYLLRGSKSMFFIAAYLILLYFLSHYLATMSGAPLLKSDKTIYFYNVNIFFAFLSGFAFLRLFINEYENKQGEIVSKNIEMAVAIEDLKTKNEEINLLYKELNHRTKNNLQLVSSIINMQSQSITNPIARQSIEDTKNRIFSISLLYQKLYINKNLNTFSLTEFFKDILKYLRDTLITEPDDIEFNIEMDSIELQIDNAILMGLVINEILTNSFKHGLPNGSEKRYINLSLKRFNNNGLKISVADSGKGIINLSANNYSNSFGAKLIHSLVLQMSGAIYFNVDYDNEILIIFNEIS